ncbi:hypothetical protein [Mycolicibacterium nivoides]|uniref:hypothetical protein n=1 Tax=Mycolicibacterium nivoides TaxID=2487344 RepID=UPI001F14FDC7|nr:hypothetical protein [Mycolicibacterium nivoides]
MSPAAAPAPLPTKSEIEEWSTSHLSEAATTWRTAATGSENAFDEHRQNISSPGGTTWTGDAKDAALDRVTKDVAVVGRQNSVLREAATLAENGAHDIKAAKDKAVEAITAAENDGFSVGEDLSVTDTREYDIDTIAERNRALAEHAEDIRWTAQQLVQADQLVGNRLEAKAADLEGIRFEGEAEDTSSGRVHLADHTVKHDAGAKDQPEEKKPEAPAQAPGQIGPFAVPKSVEDAAKKSGLKPDEKPPVKSDVGGDLGDLLGAGDLPAAGAEPKPTAVPISPQAVEQFKTQARNLLRQQGVPPDQIESRVNAMVADAQRMNATLADSAAHTPAKPDTTPGPAPVDTRSLGEKLGDKFNNFVNEAHDQFYNRLDSTVETLQNLTGTGGEGRPGVLESWQQLGEAAAAHQKEDPFHLRDPLGPLGPWGAVNDVVHDIPEMIDNPGKYAGDKAFDATAMAATAPLGAEGLLGKSVLPELGALERSVLPEVGALERGAPPVVPHTAEPPVVPHTAEPPVAPRTAEAPPIPHSAEPVVPHTAEPPPVPHTADPPAGHPAPSADAPVEHPAPPPDTPAHHVPDQVPSHPLPPPDVFDPHQGMHYNSGDPYHPGGWPPSTPDPTWTKGDTTPGWEHMNRGPEKPWMPYQEQITGIERTPDGRIPEYVLVDPDTGAPVRMDSGPVMRGDQEVFLDAKREYEPLFKYPEAPWVDNIRQDLLKEAQRQLNALPDGAILEWHVANPQSAAIMRDLLESRGLDDVHVIYTPQKP